MGTAAKRFVLVSPNESRAAVLLDPGCFHDCSCGSCEAMALPSQPCFACQLASRTTLMLLGPRPLQVETGLTHAYTQQQAPVHSA